MAERKKTTKPMKGENKKERFQYNPSKRKKETMKVKGDDPDTVLEKGKTPASGKRAT